VKSSKKQSRPLTLKETKALTKIRSTAKKELKVGYRTNHMIVAIMLGTVFTYLAFLTKYNFLILAFGTIAVLSFGFVVFMPFEIYRERTRLKQRIKQVDDVLTLNSIEVTPMAAKQVALAKQFEDEGDLYIIEMDTSHILYLWDKDHNLKKNFPCLEFEIYSDDFHSLIGRQINPLNKKFKPLMINAKSKWAYFKKQPAPEHLSIEKRSFKKLVDQMSGAV
jgi:hypothetical protein